ncbi:helix-turn-helix domain-containing protein [Actinocatenispora sera]|uniref:HTH cro/C1-type domain-containing protein n=1 Tax=Actinocatenispora sera TaxID=390989 RepID=A0A810L4C7_9ACTN|nr:helix-turn-helix transcriptional regulator [Actinocatenispora sera]BCJ30410.1 hypothetical protein Asera_45180 [Actinocatenispora sera]
MEIEDLGRQLRARRLAHDATLAAVAERAGLSVPYIANLENGRGNPTLAALDRLVAALGARLVVVLAEPDAAPGDDAAGPPASLTRFAQSTRFRATARRLAEHTGRAEPAVRELLIEAMTRLGTLAPDGGATDRDWQRVLDAATLVATAD